MSLLKSIPCKIVQGRVSVSPISIARFAEEHEGKTCDIVVRETRRTSRQNRALHKYFSLLADELNNAGYNVQLVLKEKVEIDWTPEMIKEVLWRPAMKVILQKQSTTEMKKGEDIDKVYEHLNRHLGEKFGVHVPWPHYETEQEFVEATSLSTSR